MRLNALSGKKRQQHADALLILAAFQQFQSDLTRLQVHFVYLYDLHKQFVELNATATRKILKKWDKRSGWQTKERFLSQQVEIQPCFNGDVLAQMSDTASNLVAQLETLIAQEGISADVVPSPVALDDTQLDSVTETQLLNALNAKGAELDDAIQQASSTVVTRLFFNCCLGTVSLTPNAVVCLVKSGKVNFGYTDDISERTCLHEAAAKNLPALVAICIEHGDAALTTHQDVAGRQPLHYAAVFGHVECVKLLLSGVKVLQPDNDGYTPLLLAAVNGHLPCVHAFLGEGYLDSHASAAFNPLSLACEYGHAEIVELLLKYGASMEANSDGLFPLHLSCQAGSTNIVNSLIRHGANVEQRDIYTLWRPIFYAASEGRVDCVRLLIERGCRLDVVDEFGWTPRAYALWNGHIEVADLLTPPEPIDSIPEFSLGDAAIPPPQVQVDSPEDGFGDHETPSQPPDALPSLSLPPPAIPTYGMRIFTGSYF
jgi:CDK inhibitor PHO81